MNLKKNEAEEPLTRRFRLHEILIALINQQKDLELMDDGVQIFENPINHSEKYDSSRIIEYSFSACFVFV